MSTDRIDLIIPVYKGADSVRACLDSVYAAAQRQPFEIILVDDASPEPGVRALLAECAERPNTTLLTHPDNLGFVESVNRAAARHPQRDILILNSDTRVSGDWLDRLWRCAHSDRRIATVTPFSNNATLCSYPIPMIDNPLPDGLDAEQLDALFRQVNAGRCVDIPTGVGFCMYIRRAAWQAGGGFDARRYGRGYGEENDFCRRLAAADWRNVICADAFVYHEGAVSFGEQRHALQQQARGALLEAHPDYETIIRDFVADDPLRAMRQAVDAARIGLGTDQARCVLREREQERDLAIDLLRTDYESRMQILQQEYEAGLGVLESYVAALKQEIEGYAAALERAEDFVRSRERELADLQTALEQVHAERARLDDALQQQIAHNQALRHELELIYASRSWRYTRFLRRA